MFLFNEVLTVATKSALKTKTKRESQQAESTKKWGKALMDAGFTILPSTLISKQHALGLDALDFNIVLHLVNYWWRAGSLPFPSKQRLAESIGVDPSTIRRRIAKLEHSKLIVREKRYHPEHKGQQNNAYRLDGLIAALTPHAQEAVAARKLREADKDARRRRKKARLVSEETETD